MKSGISMTRVIMKLDAYYAAGDSQGAIAHLDRWLAEARAAGDNDAVFALENERIGHFRKNGPADMIPRAVKSAREAGERLGIEGTAPWGTMLVNAGTALSSAGKYEQALEMLEEARRIYARELPEDDIRRGFAANNAGCALEGLKRWGEAHRLYREALDVLSRSEGGEQEMAVTHLNMARAAESEHGEEKAEEVVASHCEKAYELLSGPGPARDAEHAFVCEWCAGELGRHGFFLYEKELRERAKAILAQARE